MEHQLNPIQATLPAAGAVMSALTAAVDQVEDFDIEDYEHACQAAVTIKHPMTGEPTRIRILLASPEHPTRKRINMDAQRKLRAHLSRHGKMPVRPPEEDEEEELATLVACTLGWENLKRGGQVVEFSPSAARALYGDTRMRWLRDQVRDAMQARETFIQRSARG